jgi:hypothetical protein
VNRRRRLCVLLLSFFPTILLAQTNPPSNESGKFRLHKFEQPIGEETYTITPDGNVLTLKCEFKFMEARTLSQDERSSSSVLSRGKEKGNSLEITPRSRGCISPLASPMFLPPHNFSCLTMPTIAS